MKKSSSLAASIYSCQLGQDGSQLVRLRFAPSPTPLTLGVAMCNFQAQICRPGTEFAKIRTGRGTSGLNTGSPAKYWTLGNYVLAMVKHCVAAGCSNTIKDGVSLFLFPKDAGNGYREEGISGSHHNTLWCTVAILLQNDHNALCMSQALK